MKHSLVITLIIVALFFVSQIVGLAITNQYVAERDVNETTGEVNITYKSLPMDLERPEVEESKSYIFIILAVLIGTALVLLLIKFKAHKVWKVWFLLSVTICLFVAFSAFVWHVAGLILAIIVALWKTYRPGVIVHNLSEIFIYGGLAAIFVPIMNIWSAVILLVVISIYDMIAVWQSKHMIKMAKFQTKSQVFAGLSIPYKFPSRKKGKKKGKGKKEMVKSAILGGGDIGFPLLFTGVVMKQVGFLKVTLLSVVVTGALFLLLYYAKKDRFYPAMPFISMGCFVGYALILLI
ncbi:presenilin family intramembrane aspartyl protease [Nanoarchaeota archaeon]